MKDRPQRIVVSSEFAKFIKVGAAQNEVSILKFSQIIADQLKEKEMEEKKEVKRANYLHF